MISTTEHLWSSFVKTADTPDYWMEQSLQLKGMDMWLQYTITSILLKQEPTEEYSGILIAELFWQMWAFQM